MLEPAVFGVPSVRVDRLEPFDRKRPIDDRARLGQLADSAGSHHLQADVAERSRLRGAGDHRAARGIGGPLLEQTIARSAADDANLVEAVAGELLERLQHRPVLECQAL